MLTVTIPVRSFALIEFSLALFQFLTWTLAYLICETLWTGARSGLLISVLEKLDWFLLKVRLNYATTNHLLPPPITSQNISTTTHKHPKMGYHLLKTKIYSYITSFWHFNSFFFCKMHYSFPWRRSCMLSFDQFVFQIQYFYDILHI